MCGHVCEPDYNLPESVFSFHHSGRGIKLKSPGSVVSAFYPLDNLKFGFSCFILCKSSNFVEFQFITCRLRIFTTLYS